MATVVSTSERHERDLKVLLVQPPKQESVNKEYIATQIPISLCLLAAVLESLNADVKIIDFYVDEYSVPDLKAQLESFKPDIVGVGSLTASINFVEEIARTVKLFDPAVLTVLGGAHVSALPEQTIIENPSFDIAVVGEGEETLKEIYLARKNGAVLDSIRGICYRNNGDVVLNPRRVLIQNLDDVPFAARHLLDMSKYRKAHVSRGFSRKTLNIMEISTSRGCPNKCIFCAGHVNYGFSLRFRSFENIRTEILQLKQTYHVNHITFNDDTFTLNKKLVKRIAPFLKEEQITWDCNARVNTVNLELLQLMQQCGCKKISFGVESGSPRMLKLMKKGIALDQVRDAFRNARTAGFKYVEGTFMLGSHPDETLEDIEMTRKLMFEIMPDFISLSIISPFPGTETYDLMIANGQLAEHPDWKMFTMSIQNALPFERLNNLTAGQLITLQHKIIKAYYANPAYLLKKIAGIRTMDDLMYFARLGVQFVSEFILKKKQE